MVYTVNIPPLSVTPELYTRVDLYRKRKSAKQGKVVSQGEVLRAAVDRSMKTNGKEHPEHPAPVKRPWGKLSATLSGFWATEKQREYLDKQAAQNMSSVSHELRVILDEFLKEEGV